MRIWLGISALAVAALCALASATDADARTIRTAAIVVHFEGETPDPNAADYAEATLFGTGPKAFGWSARHYFQSVSYGQIDMAGGAGDVYGPYETAPFPGFCNYGQWFSEAKTAAAADGFEDANYDSVVIYLEPAYPSADPCAYGVNAGSVSWMKGNSPYVTFHELAHGLASAPGLPGSPHASGYRCTEGGAPVAYSASCEHVERADTLDLMGFGMRGALPLDMSAWRKLNFGVIPAADAPTIAYSGTYTVAPLEQPSGVRLLRVPTGDGRFFDLDFRQPLGFYDSSLSPTEPVTNGVTIRVDPPAFNGEDSHLLDTTPATASWDDAPLTVGRSFRDFRTGVTIETLAAGAAGATVRISGLPDPPTATTGLPAARCKVPKLQRKKLKAARKALKGKPCKPGKVTRRHSKQVPKGKVVSQQPAAGKSVPAGTAVKIVVSSGPPKAAKKGR